MRTGEKLAEQEAGTAPTANVTTDAVAPLPSKFSGLTKAGLIPDMHLPGSKAITAATWLKSRRMTPG
jgi:hypothetical protein